MKINKDTLLIYLAILLAVISLVMVYDSYRTKSQLKERDILIEEMKLDHSARSQRIDTLVRTITNDISISQGGRKLNSDELISYISNLEKTQNVLANEINTLNDSLQYYKVYFDLSQKHNKSSFSVKKDNSQVNYTLRSNSINIDSAKAIVNNTIDENNKIINSLYDEISELKLKLNMYEKAIKKYGIEFNNVKREKDEISYIIQAPQVDSALMLLPIYRKELKYDAKKKQWSIGIKKWF